MVEHASYRAVSMPSASVRRSIAAVLALVYTGYSTPVHADTAIETETAQIGKKGDRLISQSYEYARAQDGTSGGTLTQFEYGLSDDAELLVEPFFYTWEHPTGESRVDGFGDLEITPSYQFVHEDHWVPAILLAFKLKVPTGSARTGGSGQPDYMPYLIFGQHCGAWTFNVNLGVNFVTPSDDESWTHTNTWAVETEREIAPKLTMFLEGFSTEDHVRTASTALEYQWTESLNTFVAAGYTEEDEAIFRLGVNIQF